MGIVTDGFTRDPSSGGAGGATVNKRFGATLYNPAGIAVDNYDVGTVEKVSTLIAVRIKVKNGTSLTVNVRKNGTTTLLVANQTVAAAASYTSFTAAQLQNTGMAAGDWLEVMVITNTGAVTQASVQPVFQETD